MRFIKFTDELLYAICEFCEMQNNDTHYQDYDILGMLRSAADEFAKIDGFLPVTEICRYHIFSENADRILPEKAEHGGVIYESAVHLGTFNLYNSDDKDTPDHKINCGYDVVYDTRERMVRLLYRVEISNEFGTTLYRVEDSEFENFETSEFIVGLSIQLAEKLRNGGEYLRKVCDYPCA